MNNLTEIDELLVRSLPDGAKIVASVFDLDYAAYPNTQSEQVELEDGTIMFNGIELWLVPPADGKKVLLLNINGLDAKTFQLARTMNEASLENYDEYSAVVSALEEAILDFENDKYNDVDYRLMREDEAGDRAYHDSIDA